jgi:hypothetical protein
MYVRKNRVFCFGTIPIPNFEWLNKTHRGLHEPIYNTWDGAIGVSYQSSVPKNEIIYRLICRIMFCTSWQHGSLDRSNYIHPNFHAPVSYLGEITNNRPCGCTCAKRRHYLLWVVGPSTAQWEIESFCSPSVHIVKLDTRKRVFLTFNVSSRLPCQFILCPGTEFQGLNYISRVVCKSRIRGLNWNWAW